MTRYHVTCGEWARDLLDRCQRVFQYSISQVANSQRVKDFIFDKPQFTVDGFGTSDVQQGRLGDCWWVASAAALCNV